MVAATNQVIMKPQELLEFKDTKSLVLNTEIPQRAENRRKTDRKFLIVYLLCVFLLIPFIVSTLFVIRDDGIICGENCSNDLLKAIEGVTSDDKSDGNETFSYFKGKTLTTGNFTVATDDKSDGIESPSYLKRAERNINDITYTTPLDDIFNGIEIHSYLRSVGWKIAGACFSALGVNLAMFFLFKHLTTLMVWGILIGNLVLWSVSVIVAWFVYVALEDINKNSGWILFLCIFLTLILLFLFCITVFLRKKIGVIIKAIKQSMNAVSSMPLLMLLPIVILIINLLILVLLAITSFYAVRAVIFTIEATHGVMIFTFIFNCFMAFWSIRFILGIYYMIIAGSVASWYFARDKKYMDNPILKSTRITFKYHLGTSAFGSLLMTATAGIYCILKTIIRNKCVMCCFQCWTHIIEKLLAMISRNSYILTAMHGSSFIKSGKRAAEIIFKNGFSILLHGYIVEFVLGVAQVLIFMITMLITYLIMKGDENGGAWMVYCIVFIITIMISIPFFAIFVAIIDTIFLCYCEDILLNDGLNRPYAMTRELKEFIEHSKKGYEVKTN